MRYVVMFSGGVTSWASAKRLRDGGVPPEAMTLLFADTLIEDEDCYRFLVHAATNLRCPLTPVAEGRTPWQVFRDKRFIGNTRADVCSRVLKREFLRAWLEDHCFPNETRVVIGYDAEEQNRVQNAARYWSPWTVLTPLLERPALAKDDVLAWCKSERLRPPRLYAMGFAHNNCGGFCVKAGHEQFATLLRALPARYAEHEYEEEETRQVIGKDVAILRDRRGGELRPLTMREFRRRVQAQEELDAFGGSVCACFSPGIDGGSAPPRPQGDAGG